MYFSAVSAVVSMKAIAPATWVLIGLLTVFHAGGVVAASAQEKPAASATKSASKSVSKKPQAAKKAPAKKTASPQKKRAPIASKSKSAHEVAKTPLPPANLDLSLPHDMVQKLQPPGTVPLPQREPLLPSMFGQKPDPFQLNGRLLNNEMQLPLRNSERREVEGAALDFEFKR